MLRDQNEKSMTTSVPARTSSTRRARSASSTSRRTSCRSGIAVMPRDQASWSKDSRVMPCCSYRRATVDFPDPAGPHIKMTRPMRATLGAGGLAGSGRVLGGWGVAVEGLLAVGAAGFGGAVGVQGELPASSVDADVVVELADQDEVAEGGFAAVLFVAQVVDVAVDGGAAAAGPGAGSVAEQDGAADVPGDRCGCSRCPETGWGCCRAGRGGPGGG